MPKIVYNKLQFNHFKMHQKIQNLLGATISLFLIVLTITAVTFTFVLNNALDTDTTNQFSVSAEASVDGSPDIADFNFTVLNEGEDQAALQQENAEKSATIIAELKDLGISAEDIKTAAFNINPKYQYFPCNENTPECKPAEITGYSVRQNVQVTIRDFEIVSDALNAAVQNGANEVSQLTYRIEDPTEYRNEAREEAIAKARAQAKQLAEAGDFKLGKLISIDEGEGYNPLPYYAERSAVALDTAEESAISAPVEPGTEEVKVNVTLRYRIK